MWKSLNSLIGILYAIFKDFCPLFAKICQSLRIAHFIARFSRADRFT
jgi:hypothetical protein